ncbi:peptidyl-prolyl cis-trans isomerase B (cyclophilin B) [Parapedobacter composti]|uniref:peptidylprolyl isomerase n=1 Tax=Parapedobacter composti TaxID=623281 RepID=A0A1I1IL45_9SPHI|nr:peptidylprolyl isomerase [Parapedobacter composti]SFC36681.1 peptidyl-prolyl cis-trans isomerase B (cyclophilin B) [Parapedobacter composti]
MQANFLKKSIVLAILSLCCAVLHAAPPHKYVRLITPKGECLVKLYDETPLHRDNFAKLVREGFYDNLLFHRVIRNFMIQGGDPNSRYAAEKQRLGEGGPGYTIPAEFRDSLFHKKGVIAAARDNNPEKASSGSQFYLVQGRTFTDRGLDSLEQLRLGGRKIPPHQREVYRTLGGTPHLDQNYTVFGEVISGIDVIDSIASVATDPFDRPIEDQRMTMELLTRREAINLERQQAGLEPRTGIFTKFIDLFKPKY